MQVSGFSIEKCLMIRIEKNCTKVKCEPEKTMNFQNVSESLTFLVRWVLFVVKNNFSFLFRSGFF